LFAAGGCASKSKKEHEVAIVRFLLEAGSNNVGAVLRLPVSGVTIPVEPNSHFAEFDVEKVEAVKLELGDALAFKLSSTAGRDLYRLSVANQGKRLVTVLNGRPIGARRIEGPLAQGYIVTYVELPDVDLEKLARNIELTSADVRAEIEKKNP
jgi:hypothetical protein